MKIVIVGDGSLGYPLIEQLYQEGHDITVVDTDAALLDRMSGVLDVIGVLGNGASMEVLKEANVVRADLVITATSIDELNMICCLVARKMGAKRTIASIGNPEYNEQMRMLLQKELGLSMMINPYYATAAEISWLIHYQSAIQIESFAQGRINLISVRVNENTLLSGLILRDTWRILNAEVLVCAVEREDKLMIPNGDFALKAGDNIHITGTTSEIVKCLKKTGHILRRIRNAIMIGGGYTAIYLAQILAEMRIGVKIIEKHHEKCVLLCEKLQQDVIVIEGDGTDHEILDQEGLENADVFVALTDADEKNLVAAMYAADRGVDKTIARLNQFDFPNIIHKAGISSIVNPRKIITDHIIRFVRGMEVNLEDERKGELLTLYKIFDGRAEALYFRVGPDTPHLNLKIAEMPLKADLLIAMIVRHGKARLPKADTLLMVNDSVLVIAKEQKLKVLSDIFKG